MPAPDHVEGVRRRNLATVLDLVHHRRVSSRADVTALTGLNRSTVAALVAELVALGLLEEGDPVASSRVGRPSPVVHPDPRPVVIAVNPEVDAVTAAVVGLGARVERRVRRPVDAVPTPEDAVAIIADVVRELVAASPRNRRVAAIGLAIPGLVRASDRLVRWASHLGWREVPFAAMVEDAVGLPVVADNDASLGALAEHLFGAGRGVDDLIYLNGGASGIGGGAIVRGSLLTGRGGYAGEFGQNRPGVDDPHNRVTSRGTLEDEVSRARVLDLLGLESADEPQLAAAIETSASPAVRVEMRRQQGILAAALGNAVNVFNPELVVLGGYLATHLAWDPPSLEDAVRDTTVPAAWEGTSIVPAALGEDRLLIGAAELAFRPLLRDPGKWNP
ncbi:MAG: ROK family protein [Pseudolysinimonas sp.]|uniref:ROK family protein n=1 Tax=Pseudolysinimonas sp. TaxID=2680009 RepID=UPI003264101E